MSAIHEPAWLALFGFFYRVTRRSTRITVSFHLIASDLISSPPFPPLGTGMLQNPPPRHATPAFLPLRNSIEDRLFSSSCRVFILCLYSSLDFNYLANLFNFHREWESENSRSLITAHTGGEHFTPLLSPTFVGKLCQIQTNSLIITCLFTYALLTVKYSGPFCSPLFRPLSGLNVLFFIPFLKAKEK